MFLFVSELKFETTESIEVGRNKQTDERKFDRVCISRSLLV